MVSTGRPTNVWPAIIRYNWSTSSLTTNECIIKLASGATIAVELSRSEAILKCVLGDFG
ncbi:hypothetical protein KSP40_PGU017329 [Platanthera guangdongensis]|uniref:Uncharacterized protein n=1 Tax=Platanthera guangdongensis TaxID=2320717 RepID=A0ABR2LCB0_9ASPA